MKVQALKGFKDILPGEVELWQYVEKVAREIFCRFHFSEIRLPILEETKLFARAIGEATDIVEKEMYTFVDKKITMRPEATASLIRAYVEHGLYVQKPIQKLFTIGPMFRHERPQKGRLRQFHQIDLEVLGSESPRIDAELMALGALLFQQLGIVVSLEVNSLGCPLCRPNYRQVLVAYIEDKLEQLCSDCKRRSVTNPLRVLDCKVPSCKESMQEAPAIQEHLCSDCTEHFDSVLGNLTQLNISYSVNKFMVRGLDYYCRTTFEFLTGDLGAQAAVAAGGRYDGLVEQLGGPKNSPGIGFAIGMERVVLLVQQHNAFNATDAVDIHIAALGENAGAISFNLAHVLRSKDLTVSIDYENRSLKSQMKLAHKNGAKFVLIIGDGEVQSGKAILRNMGTEEQLFISFTADDIARHILN